MLGTTMLDHIRNVRYQRENKVDMVENATLFPVIPHIPLALQHSDSYIIIIILF